jgi:hypothetical protein
LLAILRRLALIALQVLRLGRIKLSQISRPAPHVMALSAKLKRRPVVLGNVEKCRKSTTAPSSRRSIRLPSAPAQDQAQASKQNSRSAAFRRIR